MPWASQGCQVTQGAWTLGCRDSLAVCGWCVPGSELPFPVTSVIASMKRAGVSLLQVFLSHSKSPSTFSEYFGTCQVRNKGKELPEQLPNSRHLQATLGLKGHTPHHHPAPIWLFSAPFLLNCSQ